MCFDVCELCKRLDSKILITSVSFECRVIMTRISLSMFFIKPPMQHLLNRKNRLSTVYSVLKNSNFYRLCKLEKKDGRFSCMKYCWKMK